MPAVRQLSAIVDGQAVVLAYADISRDVGWLTLALAPLALLLRAPSGGGKVEVEA